MVCFTCQNTTQKRKFCNRCRAIWLRFWTKIEQMTKKNQSKMSKTKFVLENCNVSEEFLLSLKTYFQDDKFPLCRHANNDAMNHTLACNCCFLLFLFTKNEVSLPQKFTKIYHLDSREKECLRAACYRCLINSKEGIKSVKNDENIERQDSFDDGNYDEKSKVSEISSGFVEREDLENTTKEFIYQPANSSKLSVEQFQTKQGTTTLLPLTKTLTSPALFRLLDLFYNVKLSIHNTREFNNLMNHFNCVETNRIMLSTINFEGYFSPDNNWLTTQYPKYHQLTSASQKSSQIDDLWCSIKKDCWEFAMLMMKMYCKSPMGIETSNIPGLIIRWYDNLLQSYGNGNWTWHYGKNDLQAEKQNHPYQKPIEVKLSRNFNESENFGENFDHNITEKDAKQLAKTYFEATMRFNYKYRCVVYFLRVFMDLLYRKELGIRQFEMDVKRVQRNLFIQSYEDGLGKSGNFYYSNGLPPFNQIQKLYESSRDQINGNMDQIINHIEKPAIGMTTPCFFDSAKIPDGNDILSLDVRSRNSSSEDTNEIKSVTHPYGVTSTNRNQNPFYCIIYKVWIFIVISNFDPSTKIFKIGTKYGISLDNVLNSMIFQHGQKQGQAFYDKLCNLCLRFSELNRLAIDLVSANVLCQLKYQTDTQSKFGFLNKNGSAPPVNIEKMSLYKFYEVYQLFHQKTGYDSLAIDILNFLEEAVAKNLFFLVVEKEDSGEDLEV